MWEADEIIENDDDYTEVESLEVKRVREKLQRYAEKSNTRLTNIESYVRIYKAIEQVGNRHNLFELTKVYEQMFGEDIPKSTLHAKIARMKKMGI